VWCGQEFQAGFQAGSSMNRSPALTHQTHQNTPLQQLNCPEQPAALPWMTKSQETSTLFILSGFLSISVPSIIPSETRSPRKEVE
jgi:hypothetical protein